LVPGQTRNARTSVIMTAWIFCIWVSEQVKSFGPCRIPTCQLLIRGISIILCSLVDGTTSFKCEHKVEL
jgi:hypothetical protein